MAIVAHPTPPRPTPTLPHIRGRNPLPPNARDIPEGWGVARRRISRLTLASLALLAVAAVGLVQVLQTTHVAATGYEVRALEREQQDLDADIRLLGAQIAASSNLGQLQKEATARLGMVRPQQTVRVAQDVAAPAIVPLPRRYVPMQERDAPPGVAWWERVLGVIPGMH
ncbi:MAG: hypothetical protein EXR68_06495 [Dehalococcoidia bacterium]|nr:hypothetical protein [Dehalococcoidia bacterium]